MTQRSDRLKEVRIEASNIRLAKAAKRILTAINRAENFAMAHDGPVPKTSEVMPKKEIEQLLRDAYIVAVAWLGEKR